MSSRRCSRFAVGWRCWLDTGLARPPAARRPISPPLSASSNGGFGRPRRFGARQPISFDYLVRPRSRSDRLGRAGLRADASSRRAISAAARLFGPPGHSALCRASPGAALRRTWRGPTSLACAVYLLMLFILLPVGICDISCRSRSSSAGRSRAISRCFEGRWCAPRRSWRCLRSRCCLRSFSSANSAKVSAACRRRSIGSDRTVRRRSSIPTSSAATQHFYWREGDARAEPQTKRVATRSAKPWRQGGRCFRPNQSFAGSAGERGRLVQARRQNSRQAPPHHHLRAWREAAGAVRVEHGNAQYLDRGLVAVSSAQPCTGEARVRPPTDAWSTVDPTVDLFCAYFRFDARRRSPAARSECRCPASGVSKMMNMAVPPAFSFLITSSCSTTSAMHPLLAAFEEGRVADILIRRSSGQVRWGAARRAAPRRARASCPRRWLCRTPRSARHSAGPRR